MKTEKVAEFLGGLGSNQHGPEMPKLTSKLWFKAISRHYKNYSAFASRPSMLIEPAPDEARINKPPVTAIFLKNSN